MFDKLRAALRRFNDAAPKERRIRVTNEGVVLWSAKSERTLWQVHWQNVQEIVAYKVDAYTIDHICLGFRESGQETFSIATEDVPGWDELCEELECRFGIVFDAWFAQVAFPAFAENYTVLWKDGGAVTDP